MNPDRRYKIKYYKFEDGQPVECTDILDWSKWFTITDRTVARTIVNDAEISTVFLGIDHDFSHENAKPILWETLVFGGELAGEMERYDTLVDAKVGHKRMCAQVAAANEDTNEKN